MKTIRSLFLISLFAFITSSFILKTENDKKLVGIWKGFEKKKQLEGIEKHWIVQRFSNGKYVIMFTAKQGCEIETFTEKGKWWTKGDVFYEQQEGNESIESYQYSIKENLVVHFKSLTNTYEFEDYRLED
ncbi:hypothetical protein [Flavobacterium sp. GCM10023249]|uniref:hypothetical protein n=1 Tax=unclassified Flavobacterium TaxID=196869 RepID=UPI0036238B1F